MLDKAVWAYEPLDALIVILGTPLALAMALEESVGGPEPKRLWTKRGPN